MIVAITGASAGLGRAAAAAFAADGWDVALLARGRAGLDGAAADVRAHGRRALPIAVDVADADAVEAAAARIEAELGPIDVWVNDAMESVFAPIDQVTPEEFRRVTEVNYLGFVHGTQAALRRMKPRDRGVIVQVGSALAYRSIPLQAAYCASKHAIVGFTDSLRCELIHDRSHVKVTVVHMPALNTPQFDWVRSRLPHQAQPVPPIFQPEVGARAILHAAKHPRRELLVGSPTFVAIWGQKFVPGLLDWFLGRTGYDAQQTDVSPTERRDNLDEPLDATVDHGAHGRFDDRARDRSPALGLAIHRWAFLGATSLAAVALGVFAARVDRPHGSSGRRPADSR
jgi:NAD(P)-dependent dehydrogenase (short-subunit alcohol dehydrogenase family)